MGIMLWWPDDVCLCSWRHMGLWWNLPWCCWQTTTISTCQANCWTYIDLFSSATILQTCQPILTTLNANKNDQHVLLFARKLDYHLHTKFFTGNWSNNPLQNPINQLKVDRSLPFFLEKIITRHLNSRITNQALKSGCFCFCKKIQKKKVCNLFSQRCPCTKAWWGCICWAANATEVQPLSLFKHNIKSTIRWYLFSVWKTRSLGKWMPWRTRTRVAG